jgi:hypothetical protein
VDERMTDRSKWQPADDYHDPTAGFGGAPPARSALTLRLILAVFGLLAMCAAGAIALTQDAPVVAVIAFVIALTALIDLVVILSRKRRHV